MTEDEPTTREEYEEAIGHMTFTARRCFPVVGSAAHPSEWDKLHERINEHLDARERCSAAVPA